ncbi:sensor histidine kinase [Desulfobacula toluolica]|uniref:histidine kinase n=1 Tax=Desulfobacula toluolica (strain DSM 7467 / Tol2) TaxID=651182 RepID=K0NP50_DESTT|nr:HAMP domain-containing sensor histidine kinase [Desulfobacula toluolica]CCK80537.1 two component system sensor histidine kinase [Desulfobacula toluolica Tol2]
MTSKRTILFFWALFLVPTLIVAGLAFKLLFHEQERLNRLALNTLSSQAQTIADTIHITAQAVQDNMGLSLLQLAPDRLSMQLKFWEASNPLVRNFFVLQNDKGLAYPVPGMGSTPEERRFIDRYEALFSGRLAFDYNDMPSKDEAGFFFEKPLAPVHNDLYSGKTPLVSAASKNTAEQQSPSARQNLVTLSRSPLREVPRQEDEKSLNKNNTDKKNLFEKDRIEKTGWIPWFSENRLFILVWAQQQKNDDVYGVELELMTLLSRLVVDFPPLPQENAALVLMDGNGNALHQSGNFQIPAIKKPDISLAVSPLLPHWKITVFMNDKKMGNTLGFFYLSCVLLGIFLVAIISGGALLTHMTLKNMKDARQKTSFVSSVSHELKTPLTSIRMYAELLRSGRITAPEKTDRYLSVMVTETLRLTRLINNVLDFGRLEQGKKQYHKTTFDLGMLLKHIIDDHSIRIQKHGLEIIRQFPACTADDFMIFSDADALKQVILNLIDNAIKYARQGGFIRFVLEKARTKTTGIAGTTGIKEKMILLKVCDNGPGIPKKHHNTIFEKFHRVDNSLTATHPGSGLGLSISRQIMHSLGGDLVLEQNQTGTGCCFTARIKPA